MKIETVEITSEQKKLWSDTRVALLWHCPAFSHILYTMMNKDGNEHVALFTREVPVAATDEHNLLINPDTFFKYNLNERIFICGHEISHAIFGHCTLMHRLQMRGKISYSDGEEREFVNDIFQKAMDYVINDMLVEAKVGSYNTDWLHDPANIKGTDSVIDAYRMLYDQNPKGGGGQGQGQGNGSSAGSNGKGQQGFDKHMKPGASKGQDPTQAAAQRNEAEWKTAMAGAAAAARAQGKLPANLDRMFSELLEPKVDWRDKIIGFFARKPGGGSYNWRQPDRRLITRDIIAPGRSGFGAGPVVVAVDTSGSITQKVMDMFFGELHGILDDVRPTKIFLMYCDARVGRVDEVEDVGDLLDVRRKGAPGGGGTSFVPVFDMIAEMGIEPDAVVYLTDGMGTFPDKAPTYPVLWGNIYPKSKYPFGEVVDLPT